MRIATGLAFAALMLAACDSKPAETAAAPPAAEAPAPEAATPAPQTALEQLQAQPAEQQPVFAWQQLTAYQQAHPDAQPACTSIRQAEARGVVPENIRPDSIYASHVGATVFAIQCGPQLTTVRDDPREHWLVVFTPGAADVTVKNCAGEGGRGRDARR